MTNENVLESMYGLFQAQIVIWLVIKARLIKLVKGFLELLMFVARVLGDFLHTLLVHPTINRDFLCFSVD
jgi:hypothetical protein